MNTITLENQIANAVSREEKLLAKYLILHKLEIYIKQQKDDLKEEIKQKDFDKVVTDDGITIQKITTNRPSLKKDADPEEILSKYPQLKKIDVTKLAKIDERYIDFNESVSVKVLIPKS